MSAAAVRVSVIIPLFNKEQYLRRCLDSVRAQTFADFEVIVVDDGSTDGGARIAEEYAGRDPRVQLLRQANAGPGAARNRGGREARGDLLAALDADDYWEPEYLADSVRTLDAAGEQVAALTHALRVEPGGASSASSWGRAGIPAGLYRVTARTSPRLVAAFLQNMLPSSTVVRRSVFEEAGGYYDQDRCLFAEDAYLWLKILMRYEVWFSPRPLAVRDEGSSELAVHWRGVRPVEPFLTDETELMASCPPDLRPLLRTILALRACKTASVYGYFGQTGRARELVRRFVRVSDWRLPWFFTALLGCTAAARWLGGLARLARVKLRASHV